MMHDILFLKTRFLGFQPEREIDLLWIAGEGIHSSISDDWIIEEDNEGKLYFRHLATGKTTNVYPPDCFYKELIVEKRRFQELVTGLQVSRKTSPTKLWLFLHECLLLFTVPYLTQATSKVP